MAKRLVTLSKKGLDDRTIISNAKFIFCSNFPIPTDYPMFKRRVKELYVQHKMYDCFECLAGYISATEIPGNQEASFDITGHQLMVDLD